MSTTRKIAHNTITQLIGKAISISLGLLAFGMLAHYLGTEQFGWYVTVTSFLQFVGILIDFGMIPVSAQMLGEGRINEDTLLKNLLGFRLVTAFIFLGISPLVAWFFPYPLEVKLAISFTTISFLAIALNQVFIGYYQKHLRMHIQAIAEVVSRIALVGGLALVMWQGASFLWVMGIVTLASVVYTLIMWLVIALRSPHTPTVAFDWGVWKRILQTGWPIAISIMFNVVYLKGDVLILAAFADQSQVGLYGAAYRVLDILAQTAMMIMGIMLPLLAHAWAQGKKHEFKTFLQQSFDAMMLLAIPMTAGVLVLAKPIIALVAGDDFAGAASLLQILAVAVLGVYVGAIFGHAAVAINKQKKVLWIYVSNAVITLAGYLYTIPRFGAHGAAWMSVFSELYAALLLAIAVYWYARQRISLRGLTKIIMATITMSLALIILGHWSVLALIPIAILVYFGSLYAFGGISKETLREIVAIKKQSAT